MDMELNNIVCRELSTEMFYPQGDGSKIWVVLIGSGEKSKELYIAEICALSESDSFFIRKWH